MTRLSAFVLLSALVAATPAFADNTPSDISSDVGAIQKDNQAIARTNAELANDRAAKAQDKANGNWGGQAIDSVSIGADQTKKTEKQTEKSADKKILNHDANDSPEQ